MYIYIFFFRMPDSVISKNIDISSWNTLYKAYVGFQIMTR